MVSATILAGIYGLLGTAFWGLIILTLWIWRYTSSLGGDDEDQIVELESEQQSLFSSELADLYLSIEDFVTAEEDSMPEEVSRDEIVVEVIERKIGENDLATVVDELDDIGLAEELYDNQRDAFKSSYQNFGFSAILILVLGISVVVATLSESDPFSTLWSGVYLLFIFGIGNYGYDGIKSFLEGEKYRSQFNSRWRSYNRVD